MLQKTCLNGQLIPLKRTSGMIFCCFGRLAGRWSNGEKKARLIVYNFFEKCLNNLVAAAVRALQRRGVGIFATDLIKRATQWDV
ncbi:hypothetical protein D3C81_1841510 [compost metagenome]